MSGSATQGHHHGESRWPAGLAVCLALALQVVLPPKLVLGPHYLLPALEAALLLPLLVGNPGRLTPGSRDLRLLSLALIALVALANMFSLGLLLQLLINGGTSNGRQLIYAAIGIWLTNIVVFGLAFWETDRGGPARRGAGEAVDPDFLFPQMSLHGLLHRSWQPMFIDYLYVSLTNAAAFSPTDTMPLSRKAKLLMGAQSLVSLLTVAVVAARAVNILK
ncbi:MAG: hypothetical protein ACYCO3_10010 [Mycobacteriales bacterium]